VTRLLTPGDTRSFVVEVAGHPVGHVALQRLQDDVGELTWWVDDVHRRQGRGAAAVRESLRWAFDDGGLARVQVHLDPADVASTALAVACGLRREGVLRGLRAGHGGRRDVVLHAIVRADLVDDPAEVRWGAIRAGLPTKGVAAGVLARNHCGDALVVETSYKSHWEVPGGLVETGEGLVAATRRELGEELGVALPVGALLVVDCCSTVSPDHDIVCLLFDGGVHDDDVVEAFTFPDGEILAAHWADDALLDRCGARLSRRVRAGLAALADGRLPGPPVMLRDGVPEWA
jgi:ADP-ribose pyrophosphatase YjhB (NUDIX family)